MERIKYESCPVCKSKEFEELRKGYVQEHPNWVKGTEAFIQWMECGSCGHVFTDGYLSEEARAKMTKKVHLAQRPGWNPEVARVSLGTTTTAVQLLDRSVGKRWLDVGCGDGTLMGFVAECGYKPYGIDIRPDAVQMLKAAGLDVDLLDFADLPEGRPFDVVSMRDVIEHMPFPVAAIEKAARLTMPGGLLVISTPSRESLAWKLPRANGESPYWCELEHYHIFSADCLRKILQDAGFEQVLAHPSAHYRVSLEIIARRQ